MFRVLAIWLFYVSSFSNMAVLCFEFSNMAVLCFEFSNMAVLCFEFSNMAVLCFEFSNMAVLCFEFSNIVGVYRYRQQRFYSSPVLNCFAAKPLAYIRLISCSDCSLYLLNMWRLYSSWKCTCIIFVLIPSLNNCCRKIYGEQGFVYFKLQL